jgi:hypothetical protein
MPTARSTRSTSRHNALSTTKHTAPSSLNLASRINLNPCSSARAPATFETENPCDRPATRTPPKSKPINSSPDTLLRAKRTRGSDGGADADVTAAPARACRARRSLLADTEVAASSRALDCGVFVSRRGDDLQGSLKCGCSARLTHSSVVLCSQCEVRRWWWWWWWW